MTPEARMLRRVEFDSQLAHSYDTEVDLTRKEPVEGSSLVSGIGLKLS